MNNNQKVLVSIIAAALAIVIAVGVIIWKWPSIKTAVSKDDTKSETTASQAKDDNNGEKSDDKTSTGENKVENKDTGKKTIAVTDVVASASDSDKPIVVPIYVNNNPGIVAARLFITFDTEAFSYADCEGGDIFDNCVGEYDKANKKLAILAQNGAMDSTDLVSVSGAGVLAKIILKPNKGAKPGTYTVNVSSDSEYANIDEELIKVDATAGKVILQ